MQHPVREQKHYAPPQIVCTGNGCVALLHLKLWAHCSSHYSACSADAVNPTTKVPQNTLWEENSAETSSEKYPPCITYYECVYVCREILMKEKWNNSRDIQPLPLFSLSADPAGNAWSRDSLVTLWLFQQMVSTGTSVSADLLPPPRFARKWAFPKRHSCLKQCSTSENRQELETSYLLQNWRTYNINFVFDVFLKPHSVKNFYNKIPNSHRYYYKFKVCIAFLYVVRCTHTFYSPVMCLSDCNYCCRPVCCLCFPQNEWIQFIKLKSCDIR